MLFRGQILLRLGNFEGLASRSKEDVSATPFLFNSIPVHLQLVEGEWSGETSEREREEEKKDGREGVILRARL